MAARKITDNLKGDIMLKQFTKIKIKDQTTTLKWQVPRKGKDGEFNEGSATCRETPQPEFIAALQALVPDVPLMCDLPDSWYKDKLKILGVVLSHKDGIIGATISSTVTLNNKRVIALNTPHLSAEGKAGETLPEGCTDRIEVLIDEAEKYLKGVRAQLEIFTEGEQG